jgi:hypothetical protein
MGVIGYWLGRAEQAANNNIPAEKMEPKNPITINANQ